jgi:hypothetical protein
LKDNKVWVGYTSLNGVWIKSILLLL